MAREYRWYDAAPDVAALIGPEWGQTAALIRMEYGDPELLDHRWIVTSSMFRALNFCEDDIGIPMEKLKSLVLQRLHRELLRSLRETEEDLEQVSDLLFLLEKEGGSGHG